jgi:hypothetical protein
MLLFHVALLLWLQAPGATAERPDNAELEAVCRAVLCRQPRAIRLRLEGGKSFDTTVGKPTPIVTGNLITILPGETVLVEAELKDGRLVDLWAVQKIAHPKRTLVLSFKQEPSIGDGLGMVLKIDSPFPGVLKYRLGLMRPSDDALRKTSSCPLKQGITSFEHWPYPLFQVVAADFHQVDPASEAANRCE